MPRSSFILIVAVALAGPHEGRAQTSMDGGARAAALGGATTALGRHVSGEANPASWSTLTGRAVAFEAAEAYGLSALQSGAVAYLEPTRFGTLAVGARTFGFEDYRETQFQAGVARGFRLGTTRRFHVGLSLRYHRVSIAQYGRAGTVLLGLGGLVRVRPSLQFGVQVANLTAARVAGREEQARWLATGLAYTPTGSILVVADVYKDVRFPLSARVGLEVRPVAVLAVRAGAATEPSRFTVGAGFRLGKIAADVAGERHEVLGWSPAVSFGLVW